MNGKGVIVINRAAHERLGSPDAFLVLYDAPNNTIGLKPTRPAMRNAYPAGVAGRHGGRRVNAYRLMTEHGIRVDQTLYFPEAEIDEDGILVLNLRTAVIPNRVLKHPVRRRTAGALTRNEHEVRTTHQ
jgi:hypothetical protein